MSKTSKLFLVALVSLAGSLLAQRVANSSPGDTFFIYLPSLDKALPTSTPVPTSTPLPPPTITPIPPTVPPSCSVGRCFQNPVPFGQSITIEGVEYQVLSLERPSNRITGWTPKPGTHHVAIELVGRCITVSVFGDCSVSGLYFNATSSSHGLYDLAPGTLLMPGWISQGQLLEGGELRGWVAYEIPINDTNVQLVYDWSAGKYFIATQ